MKKFIKITIILFSFILILLILIDFINSNFYHNKFESIKPNTHLKKLINEFGKPDSEFIYKELNNNIVYKYNKDFIGWETYIFVINPKDSLLVSKHIDD